MNPLPLSQRLLRAVSADFFRPLTRTSAAVYVDCADTLVEAAGEAGRLPIQEALQLIREVLNHHPRAALDDDEGAQLRDSRQKAGAFLNSLLAVGWLEEQALGLQDRRVLISPGLRPLLRMLRSLAENEIAELKTFADTLRGICETLEQPSALDASVHTGDELRSTVSDLNQRLDLAIEQLHSVEKLIAGFELRQRQSLSAADTLRVFYTEFSQGQHMVCYDVLSKGGLLPRLHAARSKVAEQREDPLTRARLAEGMQQHYSYDETEAADRAAMALQRLERSLGGLREIASAIDERMAAFNRLSQQRYRYQTELRGRRPESIKAYCDAMNAAHAQTSFRALKDEAADFRILSPEVRLLFGVDALWKSRNQRAPADLRFQTGKATEEDEAAALEALRQRQRLALTPLRAARLVARLLPEKGETRGTDEFAVSGIDEFLDLLATVAYDRATSDEGRSLKWSISSARKKQGLQPEDVTRDDQMEWRVDHFEIRRVS